MRRALPASAPPVGKVAFGVCSTIGVGEGSPFVGVGSEPDVPEPHAEVTAMIQVNEKESIIDNLSCKPLKFVFSATVFLYQGVFYQLLAY